MSSAIVRAALNGKLSHDDLSVYNAVQRLLYLGVILAGILLVLSGLSIWKPVQVQELTAVFGGYDAARYVHFFAMAAIVGFLIIHIALAILVPKSLRAMISGPLGGSELRSESMRKIRKAVPGVDPKSADQGRREAAARSVAARCSCAAPPGSAPSRC